MSKQNVPIIICLYHLTELANRTYALLLGGPPAYLYHGTKAQGTLSYSSMVIPKLQERY